MELDNPTNRVTSEKENDTRIIFFHNPSIESFLHAPRVRINFHILHWVVHFILLMQISLK